MKVDIHRENYDAYCERKTILDTQREILHKLSGDQAALSPPAPPIAYSKWHSETYDCGAMEKSLYVGRTTRVDDEDDDEDEEEEDVEEDEEGEFEEDDEEEEDYEEDDDDFV
jgi:hypothetical protein